MELLDGKKILGEIKLELSQKVQNYIQKGRRAPCLVAVLVGVSGLAAVGLGAGLLGLIARDKNRSRTN